jgi:hypothetical protein
VSLGILPYVSYLAQRLKIPAVLMSAIDPGELEVPKEVRKFDQGSYGGWVPPLVSFTGAGTFQAAPDHPHPRGTASVSSAADTDLFTRTLNAARREVQTWLGGFAATLAEQGVQAERWLASATDRQRRFSS